MPLKCEFEAGENQSQFKKRDQKEARKSAPNTKARSKRKPREEVKYKYKWTQEEHKRFIDTVRKHGKSWEKVSEAVGPRTRVNVQERFYYFKRSI